MLINDDFNFKYLGSVDVDSYLHNLENLDWEKYTFRQERYDVHAQSKTVPLIWDEKFQMIKSWEDLNLFQGLVSELLSLLNAKLGKGMIKTALLINLPAGASIKRHVDKGVHFNRNNRIHIPIQTNDDCEFEVNSEVKTLKKGDVWEINNTDKPHSVSNKGNSDRIHLLIDYFCF